MEQQADPLPLCGFRLYNDDGSAWRHTSDESGEENLPREASGFRKLPQGASGQYA